ncbi:MAG: hypothetical protein IJ243_04515 [Prevotella sp.]|nr:hypothetical protein [Prevotella sp.]
MAIQKLKKFLFFYLSPASSPGAAKLQRFSAAKRVHMKIRPHPYFYPLVADKDPSWADLLPKNQRDEK